MKLWLFPLEYFYIIIIWSFNIISVNPWGARMSVEAQIKKQLHDLPVGQFCYWQGKGIFVKSDLKCYLIFYRAKVLLYILWYTLYVYSEFLKSVFTWMTLKKHVSIVSLKIFQKWFYLSKNIFHSLKDLKLLENVLKSIINNFCEQYTLFTSLCFFTFPTLTFEKVKWIRI